MLWAPLGDGGSLGRRYPYSCPVRKLGCLAGERNPKDHGAREGGEKRKNGKKGPQVSTALSNNELTPPIPLHY